MNARIRRPVRPSTTSRKSCARACWKNSRTSRSRWCSPMSAIVRSAGVMEFSSVTISVSWPAKLVRACVGPRPKISLYRRTISLEIWAVTTGSRSPGAPSAWVSLVIRSAFTPLELGSHERKRDDSAWTCNATGARYPTALAANHGLAVRWSSVLASRAREGVSGPVVKRGTRSPDPGAASLHSPQQYLWSAMASIAPSSSPPHLTPAPEPWVRLLVAEPELGAGIPAADRATARRIVIAPTLDVPTGPWDGAAGDGAFAAVVLDGLLTRECGLAGRCSPHLVAAGDVIPLGDPGPGADVGALRWRAATDAQLAVLDRRFVAAVARWPWLVADIVRRTACWADRAAVLQAISQLPRVEDRLLALLWHLVDRWGRVAGDGVVLPLKLSHAALGTLVGARRPTVSLALTDLRDRGLVHTRDGLLVLHPDGRAELDAVPLELPVRRMELVGRTPSATEMLERTRRARDTATATRRRATEQRERARTMRDALGD